MPGFITLYKVSFVFLAGGWDKTPEGLMLTSFDGYCLLKKGR
jgi:hypothetical protein